MSRHSSGQIATVLAVALPALVAVIALCTDAAVLYANWQWLQRAADSAALAGANYLPFDSGAAQNTAVTYARNNGIKAAEIAGTPSVSADRLSLTVNLTRTVPYQFAQIIGMTSALIKVKATAGIQQNSANGRGLMPLGLSCPSGNCTGYTVGTTYLMKQNQSQTSLSSNWGALALGARGAAQYQRNLDLGFTGAIGSTVTTEPGNMVGPTSQAIGDRVAAGVMVDPSIAAGAAPAGTAPSYDPRLIVVPMVDYSASGKGGRTDVPVIQFAQMWLLGVDTSSNNATIKAVYLGTTTSPNGGTSVTNFGVLTPILLN